MTFFEAISSGFRNYVGFSGRASRSEFWYWVLFSVLVSIACQSLILVAVGQNHGAFVNLEPGDLTAIARGRGAQAARHRPKRLVVADQLHSSGRHYRADRLLVSRGNSRL